MAVTTPGTPTLVSYVDYDDTPSLTWTASSVTSGDVIQWYELNYVNSASGIAVWTRGRYTETEVTSNSHTMAVIDGLYAHWRVRTAYKVDGVGSIVYTPYSGTLTKYILFRGTNDWTNFTNIASNITTTFEYEDLPNATSKDAGLHKKVTQNTTSSTTYTTAQNYIYRDFTGLTIGRTYYCTATAALGTASIQGNIYRFQVNTSTPTVGTAITLTTTSATVPQLTFVATGTTHRIRFELNETFTQTTAGTKEDFILRDFSLYEVLDSPYSVQPHQRTHSLAQEYDMLMNSVGGYWWVDKENNTRFSQFPITEISSATFTDEAGVAGDLHYTDIEAGYDSRNIVNTVTLNNSGRTPEDAGDDLASLNTLYNASETPYTVEDTASVDDWNSRSVQLDTNIYLPPVYNYVTSANFESNKDNVRVVPSSAAERVRKLSRLTTPISNGTTDWATVGGERCLFVKLASTPTEVEIFCNDDNAGRGIAVKGSTSYTAVGYAARYSASADTQAAMTIRWYDEDGNTISTSSSTVTSTGGQTWIRLIVTATSPSNAVAATARIRFTRSGGGAFSSGAILLADAIGLFSSTVSTFFDGDIENDNDYLYQWIDGQRSSQSVRYENLLYDRATTILLKYGEPEFSVKSLTWNAWEDIERGFGFDVGQVITVTFKGVTGNYRIVGINHDMSPESWIMKFQLTKAEAL